MRSPAIAAPCPAPRRGRAARRAMAAAVAVMGLLGSLPACGRSGDAPPPASPRPPAPPWRAEPLPLGGLLSTPAPGEDPAEQGSRGWLGVELAESPGVPGALVRAVVRGSPAAVAGVEPGDVVITLDGEAVGGPRDLIRAVAARSAGAVVGVGLLRRERQRLLRVQLGRFPGDEGLLAMNYVGAPAPRLAARTVQGTVPPELAELRGKVVVLQFWAPWCPACHVMAPLLNDWHRRLGAQGVAVLGVTDTPFAEAGAGAQRMGIEYAVAADDRGESTTRYSAWALPTLFLIDRRGTVRAVSVGYSEARMAELEQAIQRLLAE